MTYPPYDWEVRTATLGTYLSPAYYDDVLYPYVFAGKDDLQYLDLFLQKHRGARRVLELGCGSGRATERILRSLPDAEVEAVDLSSAMIRHTRERLSTAVQYVKSDSVDWLNATDDRFDLLVALWNLSHSVHQHMFRLGRREASDYVRSSIEHFLRRNLRGGSAFLIHYDLQSEEQRLINPWRLDLWRHADPGFDASGQSPSKELLDATLESLAQEGQLAYRCDHLPGDPIVYESSNRALEIFMNFHMEGHFGLDHPLRDAVISSLLGEFEAMTEPRGGTIAIRPGCFIYDIDVYD